MIVEVHQSIRETSNMMDIKRFSVLAVICILVFIPQSLAGPSGKPPGEAPDFGNVKLLDYSENITIRDYDSGWMNMI